MKIPRPLALALAAGLIAAVAIVASCSNSSNGGGGIVNPPTRELDSGTIAGSANFVHKFGAAGTFPYHCTIHGTGMAGTVTVVAGAPATQTVQIGPGNFYNPATVSVDTSGTVTWHNNGGSHTVTSN